MSYTNGLDDPSAYFHTQLYTGTGSTNAITNDANAGDFSPDWLWIKNRTTGGGTGPQIVFDTTRGNTKDLHTHNTEAEHTNSNVLLSFDTDGFSVGTSGAVNNNTDNFVAWQWKANGGTTSSNTDGSITSTVQANTTAGFSIATWTGNGTGGATIGHGLGAVPHLMIVKKRSGADSWPVYHHKNTSAPETDYLHLNETIATVDSVDRWNDTAPTSTVVSLGDAGAVNGSGATYVGYFFTEKQGYSKFGSYTGNGSTDGPMVFCGFKPAWVMVKEYAANTNDWNIYDSKRSVFNSMDDILEANLSDAEGTGRADIDFVSNGFKQRNTHADSNRSGGEFIYMAFAEHPFVSSEGVPTTAR